MCDCCVAHLYVTLLHFFLLYNDIEGRVLCVPAGLFGLPDKGLAKSKTKSVQKRIAVLYVALLPLRDQVMCTSLGSESLGN